MRHVLGTAALIAAALAALAALAVEDLLHGLDGVGDEGMWI
ncbi:hypothetical protein [Acidipropionibacterium acidipropionici]|jgi:hypothetical protein|nr:hypothetical protein [Acidipropionibacterium acidipropionici]